MNVRNLRAVATALLLGAATVGAAVPASAQTVSAAVGAAINEAKSLAASKRYKEAMSTYLKAAEDNLYPERSRVFENLGMTAVQLGQREQAKEYFQRALRLDPGNAQARLLTAQAWLEAGEAGKALEMLETLDDTPESEGLRQRAEGIAQAERSDPGYVRHLFDQFSADYDTRMREHLSYAAPEILLGLAAMVLPGREQMSVLDLGCGTGLAGEAFKPLAARLDGIDLSPAMIEKARARGLYDHLAVVDLESALAGQGPSYDLILAADTLVYLGDLAAVFRSAAQRLAPDGFFLFTVEKAADGFELGPKRRWRHGETYLRETARAAGLDVAGLLEAAPRREAGQPVEGFAVALTKYACLCGTIHGTRR